MVTAIHVEINLLLLIILLTITYQSRKNVNQQMNRVLFRNLAEGIILSLCLDITWLLLEGHTFRGARMLNCIANALFLAIGVAIGCVWYLYVLETLGYEISRLIVFIIMLPGILSAALCLLSVRTGWVFTINESNHYVRGSYFQVQEMLVLGILFLSLLHILLTLFVPGRKCPRRTVAKLLAFYIPPFLGTLAALPFSGMPGTWTCASVSIILMYLDAQDAEVLRDSLTGLNNRKALNAAFQDYARQIPPGGALYLFMIDLDLFKQINDTYGHPAGDRALVLAADGLRSCVSGRKAFVARTGGDEFLILASLPDDSAAESFRTEIETAFRECTKNQNVPFTLSGSVGFSTYEQGQTLEAFMKCADEALYLEKARRAAGL